MTHNGVTVMIAGADASVAFGDDTITVNVKQGRLVAALARAMPNPVGRDFLANKMWTGQRVPAAYETIISNIMSPIIAPLAGIGLTLKTVRGVGVALQKAGE